MTEIDIRTQILLATEARFSQYGYNKTTMAEIARDCNMSAANLYRYFDNKLDIGAALASKCLVEKEQGLVVIVDDASMIPAEKLYAFISYILNFTFQHFDEKPRLSELVETMAIQRPEVMTAHRQSSFALLSKILEEGREKKDFFFANIDDTAEAVNTAITAFYLPTVMPMFSLEEFERKAKIVFELLLTSLQNQKGH